jgi:hypothetical protein
MSSMREKQQPSPYADKPWLKHYDYWVPEQTNFARQPVHQMLNLALVAKDSGMRVMITLDLLAGTVLGVQTETQIEQATA